MLAAADGIIRRRPGARRAAVQADRRGVPVCARSLRWASSREHARRAAWRAAASWEAMAPRRRAKSGPISQTASRAQEEPSTSAPPPARAQRPSHARAASASRRRARRTASVAARAKRCRRRGCSEARVAPARPRRAAHDGNRRRRRVRDAVKSFTPAGIGRGLRELAPSTNAQLGRDVARARASRAPEVMTP